MAILRVSDFSLVSRVARSAPRLYIVTALAIGLTLAWGHQATQWLDHTIRFPGQAWLLIMVAIVLILISAFLTAMCIGTLVFGDDWRMNHLVNHRPENAKNPEVYTLRLQDKTAAFYALVVGAALAILLVSQMISGAYLTSFAERGYVLAEYRSRSTTGQARGLQGLVRYRLDTQIAPQTLRARLGELLESPSPQVRAQAAWAVGQLGVAALDPMIRTLAHDPSPEVRIQAVLTLGLLATGPGIATIRGIITDADEDAAVVDQAIIAVGLSRNQDAARDLLRAVPGFSGEREVYAFWAIGEAGDVCMGPTLLEMAAPESEDATRCAALSAMKQLSSVELVPALKNLYEQRDSWCPQVIWYGRSARITHADFHRVVQKPERIHEKILDSIFNAHASDTFGWLADVINNPDTYYLNRKHARTLHYYLRQEPNPLLEPRSIKRCPPPTPEAP